MDYHAYIDAWGGSWLNFLVIFVILALIYYVIDIWYYEDINNSDTSEIIVFSEEDTDICVIYLFDSESYYFIDDVE